MSNPDDFILVLCYANWCGHCQRFYLQENGKALSLDEVKKLDTLSWQQVKADCGIKATQFEESQLKEQKEKLGEEELKMLEYAKQENKKDGVNMEQFNLGDLSKRVQSWPTIMILKKDSTGKYVYHETYDGGRQSVDNFKNFIKRCMSMKKQEGGKKRSRKAGSKKGSRKIQEGGKRRTRKAASKKGSKKGSRKIQEGGKRRTRKTASKKGSRKIQEGGKRRTRKAGSKKNY